MDRPSIVTVAVTGPSLVSSCQPSLLANVVGGDPSCDAETPRPPRNNSRPSSSVRSSPRYTGVPRNEPVSNAYSGPETPGPLMVWGPGSIASEARSWTPALRRLDGSACGASGMSRAIWNSYQAGLV